MPEEIAKGKLVGEITHFFDKIGVGVVKLSGALKTGDEIVVSVHGQEFEQAVDSMQMEHEKIAKAKKGQEIGMKLAGPAKEGSLVYLKG
jgi:translation elongation factor EF-1alpha